VIVEVENLEVHETRIEILDSYNAMKLVALIEVVSPTNKAAGPGRASYQAKQEETLARVSPYAVNPFSEARNKS